MKILKRIIYALLGAVVLLLLVAIFVPKEYKISREIVIARPQKIVFDYVKFLRNQNNYSKWAKMDPNMRTEFRGTDGTIGFVSAWDSQDKNVGKGEQEIIGITEGERIDYELRFLKPMESKDHAFMTTVALSDSSTQVKWNFEGKMNYPMNITLLFLDLDGLLGKDLEVGLAGLKGILEKE